MAQLEPIEQTELTEYAIKLLKKHSIITDEELLAEENPTLSKLLNITETAVADIKQALRDRNPFRVQTLSELYDDNVKDTACIYQTGIAGLDELLAMDNVYFERGVIWEICGLPGIGKSQLCKTIALNFASRHTSDEVLFIDTKSDFSGTRIRQMLRSRNVEITRCGEIMNLIKVERCFQLHTVITILEQLLKVKKSQEVVAGSSIKLVIIDSLPAVCLHLNSEQQRLTGRQNFCNLWVLMAELASEYGIAFLLVNVSLTVDQTSVAATKLIEAEELNDVSTNDDDLTVNAENSVCERPALGRYWSTLPNLRLSIELPMESFAKSAALRMLRVLMSYHSRSNVTTLAEITDTGFV